MLFRKKVKNEVEQEVDAPEVNNTSPIEPYEDEPVSWKSISDEQKADVWYHLALTNESSDPGTHQPGGDDFLWYIDAAAGGNRCAQYALGKMYYKGVMTQVNSFQAGLWLSKASEAGCPFADYELGKMYSLGISMTQDENAARAYYQKAYEAFQTIDSTRQNKAIELKLAVMCENNLVDQADHITARHWRDLVSGRNESPASAPSEEQIIEQPAASEPQSSGDVTKINPNNGILMDIPVEFIVPADDNKYAANDSDEDLQNLAVSIQANGLINPITLNQKSKTKYQIISGERRYKAITKFLGWKTIPSIVYHRLSSNRAQLMLHSANLDVRDYTTGQKLHFYMEVEKLLTKMQQSGEYDGTIQKGISEAMHMSIHQIRKYQRIIDSLPKKQVKQVINGSMNLEQAYNLAKLHVVRQDEEPGRTSAFVPDPDVDEEENNPGRTSVFVPEMDADTEQNNPGRTSAFVPDPDVDTEQNSPGRTSVFVPEMDADTEQNNPGRTSAFVPEMDADTEQNSPGRTSVFVPEMDADTEQNSPGRTSAFVPEMDADTEQNAPGRKSAFEPDTDADKEQNSPGRMSAFVPELDADEEQNAPGRTSAFGPETDADEEQNNPGRTSAFAPDLDEGTEQNSPGRTSDFEDPESYQEAISLLPDLPIEPGETCAVVSANGVQSGYVDRIEIYNNALLISVLVDSIRMPYPVSMIGKTIFIGSGCFDQAKRAI